MGNNQETPPNAAGAPTEQPASPKPRLTAGEFFRKWEEGRAAFGLTAPVTTLSPDTTRLVATFPQANHRQPAPAPDQTPTSPQEQSSSTPAPATPKPRITLGDISRMMDEKRAAAGLKTPVKTLSPDSTRLVASFPILPSNLPKKTKPETEKGE